MKLNVFAREMKQNLKINKRKRFAMRREDGNKKKSST